MKKKIRKIKKVTVHRKRSIKPQAGKIGKGVIIGIAVGVLAIGAGAYFFLNQGSGSSSSPLAGIVKAPLNPNCEYNDPELCKFVNNWQSMTDYTVTSKSTAEGMSYESLFQISGQDKSRMVSKQDGKENYHVVSIGDTTYTLDYTDNKWFKYTSKPVEGELSPEQEAKEEYDLNFEETKDTTTYKFIAKEACGELMCFKYEVIIQGQSDFKEYIYFDDKDYLLRKMRSEGKDGEVNESFYSYEKVSITEPSPVKEGTPDAMYGAPAMSAEDKAAYEKMMNEYKNMESSEIPEYDASASEY